MVEAVHVGEPTLEDPTRVLAPDITNQNKALFMEAVNAGKPQPPAAAVTPTGPNEPPRSDQPSTAPLQMQAPAERHRGGRANRERALEPGGHRPIPTPS